MKSLPVYHNGVVVFNATVDDECFDNIKIFKWGTHKGGYVRRTFRDKDSGKIMFEYLHRNIMGCSKGDNKYVDHINHNRLDNRKINLRICSQFQNCANSFKRKGRHFKGVYKIKDNKWNAMITFKGHTIFLGTYLLEKDAALAYNIAATLFNNQFALLNEIYS